MLYIDACVTAAPSHVVIVVTNESGGGAGVHLQRGLSSKLPDALTQPPWKSWNVEFLRSRRIFQNGGIPQGGGLCHLQAPDM